MNFQHRVMSFRKNSSDKSLEILKGVMDRTGCKILLAQKAFSMYEVYPLIAQYLSGTTASGLYEARLWGGRDGNSVWKGNT